MLNNLRDSLKPVLQKIGKSFAATGLSPNVFTGIGLVLAFVASIIYGIGFEYSKYLAANNWDLELVAQNPEKAKKSFDLLSYTHSRYHLCNLSKPEGVKDMISKINQPNLIIANAGITKYGEIGSISKNDRESLFYLLCNGVIDLLEEYIPSMIHRGEGRIVIISSIGAITPMPKSSIYASAKSAIYSYGQSLSKELSNKNISVTVSLPGYVHTEAHDRAGLNHLKYKVPSWMWVSAEQVVAETENASMNRKSEVIPGIVYKLVRPFLRLSFASSIWNRITKRKSKN